MVDYLVGGLMEYDYATFSIINLLFDVISSKNLKGYLVATLTLIFLHCKLNIPEFWKVDKKKNIIYEVVTLDHMILEWMFVFFFFLFEKRLQ